MKTVDSDFVSQELGLLAKQKGFKDKVMYFRFAGLITLQKSTSPENYNKWFDDERIQYVSAPTKYKLQTWLRDTFKIDALPTMSEFSRKYGYNVYAIENGRTIRVHHIMSKFETFEEALEEALTVAIDFVPQPV